MRRPSSVGDRASEAQERSTVRGSAQAHSNGQNPGYGARPTRARAATRADAARAAGPGGSNEPAKRLSTHMHTQSGACAACAVQTAKVGEYPGLAPRRARACRARQRRPSGIKAAPGMRSQSCRGRPRKVAEPARTQLLAEVWPKSADFFLLLLLLLLYPPDAHARRRATGVTQGALFEISLNGTFF